MLNSYYEATKDDYKSGIVRFPLNDLSPGLHTVAVKGWDVHNNLGEGSTEFVVAPSENLALEHVLNYPNPFTTSTQFQFEHNYPNMALDVRVKIFTVGGKLVKIIDRSVTAAENTGYRIADISWNGLDDYGDTIAKGVYIYKVFVRIAGASEDAQQESVYQKLVILD